MPIYDYACLSCDFKFEVKHGINEKILKVICPKCKSEARKTPSVSSFVLKGKGWTPKFHKEKKK